MSKYIRDWRPEVIKSKISGRVAQNMDKACRFVVAQAQARAPVWRGVLRSDIDHEVRARGDVVEGIVGVRKRAFWGWFQEMGTARHAAHPFLRPAVFGNAREILRILRGE